jgi:hypothetical protein
MQFSILLSNAYFVSLLSYGNIYIIIMFFPKIICWYDLMLESSLLSY